MITPDQIKEWFKEQEDDLWDYELGYLSQGDTIELDSLPEGYTITVIDAKTKRTYDSYGYSFLSDGYLIFEVKNSLGTSEGIFKLPMTYSSYEDWGYEVDNIVPTFKQEKVITTWEWV